MEEMKNIKEEILIMYINNHKNQRFLGCSEMQSFLTLSFKNL